MLDEKRKGHRFFKTESIYKWDDSEVEIGKLRNINKEGAQILLNTKNQDKESFKGFILPITGIDGKEELMELNAKIVWESEFSGSSVMVLGVQFLDLSMKEERRLEGLVLEWTQEKMELQERLPEV